MSSEPKRLSIGYYHHPRTFDGKETEIIVFRRKMLIEQAEIAREFASRWGMVAGEVNGEDSAGRQKLRLMTPEEVVERACETAHLLMRAFEAHGWIVDLPDPKFRAEDELNEED